MIGRKGKSRNKVSNPPGRRNMKAKFSSLPAVEQKRIRALKDAKIKRDKDALQVIKGSSGKGLTLCKSLAVASALPKTYVNIPVDPARILNIISAYACLTLYTQQEKGILPDNTYWATTFGAIFQYFGLAFLARGVRAGMFPSGAVDFTPMGSYLLPIPFAKWLQQTLPYEDKYGTVFRQFLNITVQQFEQSLTTYAGSPMSNGFSPALVAVDNTGLEPQFAQGTSNPIASTQAVLTDISSNIAKSFGSNVVMIKKIGSLASDAEFKAYPTLVNATKYDQSVMWISPHRIAGVWLPLIDANLPLSINCPHELYRHSCKNTDTYPTSNASMNFHLLWEIWRKDVKYSNKATYWGKLESLGFQPATINIKFRTVDMQNVVQIAMNYAALYSNDPNPSDPTVYPQTLWSYLQWVSMIVFASVPAAARACSSYGVTSSAGAIQPQDPWLGSLPIPSYSCTNCKGVRYPGWLANIVAKVKTAHRSNNSWVVPTVINQGPINQGGAAVATPMWYARSTTQVGFQPAFPNGNPYQSYGMFTFNLAGTPTVTYYLGAPIFTPNVSNILNASPLKYFGKLNEDVQSMFTAQSGNWYPGHPKTCFNRSSSIYCNYAYTQGGGIGLAGFNMSYFSNVISEVSDEPVTVIAASNEAVARTFAVISTGNTNTFSGLLAKTVTTDTLNTSAAYLQSTTVATGSSIAQNIALSNEPTQAIAELAVKADSSINKEEDVKFTKKGIALVHNELKKIGFGAVEGKSDPSTVNPAVIPNDLTSVANVATHTTGHVFKLPDKFPGMDPNAAPFKPSPGFGGTVKSMAGNVAKDAALKGSKALLKSLM